MRFNIYIVPYLLLLWLPFYTAWSGWGIIKVFLSMVVLFGLRVFIMAKGVQVIKDKEYQVEDELILEGTHQSHYMEKVRFCMDYAGIPYTEEQDTGILGILFFGRMIPQLRIDLYDIKISSSSHILRFLYGKYKGVNPTIAAFLEPTEEALMLDKKFDIMGKGIKQYIYSQIFSVPNVEEMFIKVWGCNQSQIPWWQKSLIRGVSPLLKKFVTKQVNVEGEVPRQGLAKGLAGMKEIDELLSDGRKYLLNTPEPTFIDVTFACMAGLLLFPPEFGGKALDPESRLSLTEVPDHVRRESLELAKTPSGKFVLRIFKEHRIRKLI